MDFDTSEREIVITEQMVETSLDEPELDENLPNDSAVQFEEVVGGTKRGRRKLVSTDGYCYTVKKSKKNYTYWYCNVRSKKVHCSATVIQIGQTFRPGNNEHNHPADPGAANRVKVSAKVKEIAKQDLFRSCPAIVAEVINDVIPEGAHSLPNPDNLARAANLYRQTLRSKDTNPDEAHFEDENVIVRMDPYIPEIKEEEASSEVIIPHDETLTRIKDEPVDGDEDQSMMKVKKDKYMKIEVMDFPYLEEDRSEQSRREMSEECYAVDGVVSRGLGSMMDVRLLISKVFKRPPLWDKRNKLYANRHVIESLWADISTELECEEKLVRKKWKYLRDQYTVELRKLGVTPSGEIWTSKWQYFQQMHFLKDVVTARPSTGNCLNLLVNENGEPLSSSNEKTHEDMETFLIIENDAPASPSSIQDATVLERNVDESVFSSVCSDPKEKVTGKRPKTEELNQRLLDRKRQKIQCLVEESTEREEKDDDDEDMLFLKSLLPHIKNIPSATKLIFRSRLQELVEQFAYQPPDTLPSSSASSSPITVPTL